MNYGNGYYGGYDYESVYDTTRVASESASSIMAGSVLISSLITIAITVFAIIVMVKIYKKFGRKGWEVIVPIYGQWVLFEMADLPGWLCLIPVANVICAAFIVPYKLATKLGESTAFGICTIFFPIICYPILAFNKSQLVDGNNNNTMYQNNPQPMNQQQYVPNDQQMQMADNVQPVQQEPQQAPQQPVFIQPEVQPQVINEPIPTVETPEVTEVNNDIQNINQ